MKLVALAGAGLAALAGLALGDAMKPVLWDPYAVMGARLEAEWPIGLGDTPAAETTAYPDGAIPDYVIGTDWVLGAYPKTPVHDQPAQAAGPPPVAEPAPFASLPSYIAAWFDEPVLDPPVYPSRDGDILAGVGPPPPPPPVPKDDPPAPDA